MHNTVYKLWLGLCLLGKSCGFSKASFYLERFVPKHATSHIHKRCQLFENTHELKRIIGILLTISSLTSCTNSKNYDIENPNGIWTKSELVELNSLVSKFDQILISEYKSDSETKAYEEFSNNVFNNMVIPDFKEYAKLNSDLKNLKVFDKIWRNYTDSITNKNHFDLKYNSKYQEYLKHIGEKSEFIKGYADNFENAGDITPSVIAGFSKNIRKIDLNNKNNRLIFTIHYLTLINR